MHIEGGGPTIHYGLIIHIPIAHMPDPPSPSPAPPSSTDNFTLIADAGAPLTLPVTITGFNIPLTSITWYFEGSEVTNETENGEVYHSSFGEAPVQTTLVVEFPQPELDEGTYTVTAANEAGNTTTHLFVSVTGQNKIHSAIACSHHGESIASLSKC